MVDVIQAITIKKYYGYMEIWKSFNDHRQQIGDRPLLDDKSVESGYIKPPIIGHRRSFNDLLSLVGGRWPIFM
jgi:hypothetical protein